jgi:hypothetical protein
MPENEEISAEYIDALERSLEAVRNQFEQYFLGARRTAPLQDRTTVQYAIRKVSNYTIPNTRLRFRFQQLVSKFNSYNQYWNRTLSQIEEGKYFRDRFKMKLHTGALEEEPPPPAKDAGAKGADKGAGKATEKAPAKAAKPAAGGLSDDHIDQVHRDFVAAKKQLNQDAGISREKIAETIKKQLPELQKRYQGKDIRFKVVIEDGKAKLKATVK